MAEEKATRDGFGEGIMELAKDKNVVVLTADIGGSCRVDKFKDKYPERFFDAGIAEQNMIGMACGMAMAGKTAFAATFGVFFNRCIDQIRTLVAYQNLNVKICASHCGITVGEDGATHQMLEDIAIMRSLPNFSVIVPCDASQTKQAAIAASKIKTPVYLRFGRAKIPDFTEKIKFEIGKAQIIKKGSDITVIACGIMVNEALKAAEKSKKSVRVINMHTIKPIDKKAIIKAAKETKGIITAEEAFINGGLGSAVAEVLGENYPAKLIRIGINDEFGQSGRPDELMRHYRLTADDIVKAIDKI